MCDTCIPILGNKAKFHPGKPCVVSKTLYCSLCAVYGHSYKRCPEKEMMNLRNSPTTSAVDEPSIKLKIPEDYEDWVEVTEEPDGKCIRAMLIANSIVPMSCQEKGRNDKKDVRENTSRLSEFLKKRGKKLVLVKPPIPTRTLPKLESYNRDGEVCV